jgi:hypothetical protein
MRTTRILGLVVPVLSAVAVAALLLATRSGPERHAPVERAVPVTVAAAIEQAPAPAARGFGTARPAETWQAVAEVRGPIVWRHPDLAGGNLIPGGTKVLEIDPSEYRLGLAQAEADLAAIRAERAQLDAEAENTRAVLDLERDALALAERDLDRVRRLVEQGAVPGTRADDQERATLQARRVVRELENTLALVPSRKARLVAQSERAEAQIERARRDLELTVVTTPFNLRVDEVRVERFEPVAAGQVLATGDGIAAAEVVAQVPLDVFRRLAGGVFAAAGAAGLEAMAAEALDAVKAEVRLAADPAVRWPARVARVEGGLDSRTRSVGVVVVVDDPYAGAAPPDRLPLVRDMYVEVLLIGPPLAPRVAVPEAAVRQGIVHVLGAESRLALRPVAVAFRQDGLSWIEKGLQPGEMVVLDDLVPAIDGMLLDPVELRP